MENVLEEFEGCGGIAYRWYHSGRPLSRLDSSRQASLDWPKLLYSEHRRGFGEWEKDVYPYEWWWVQSGGLVYHGVDLCT